MMTFLEPYSQYIALREVTWHMTILSRSDKFLGYQLTRFHSDISHNNSFFKRGAKECTQLTSLPCLLWCPNYKTHTFWVVAFWRKESYFS